MGHCIQAIVTRAEIADRLQTAYPELPRVVARQRFVIFPIDAEFIDSLTEAQPSRPSDETFMLLTDSFRDFLRGLSRLGRVAYIETEYFGGTGGQGAVVYSDCQVIMEPEWRESGPINRALKMIGVKRHLLGDRFSALGLGAYRSNDDLIDAAMK
ncbi:hypothetical protein [Tautonia rosea]|uniref:hypothetical protein n=1 Tax=Tautonia rosea TaxID=2728037 RepID=UPI001474C4A4|nr:hypothetical protein [Tautonia rosea]